MYKDISLNEILLHQENNYIKFYVHDFMNAHDFQILRKTNTNTYTSTTFSISTINYLITTTSSQIYTTIGLIKMPIDKS